MSELRARYLPPSELKAVPELGKSGSYVCTAAVPLFTALQDSIVATTLTRRIRFAD